MSETIKPGKRRGFAVIYRTVAQDKRLSLKARGLFLLMMSLPETWEYTIAGLATLAGTGKDQVRSGLQELMEVGYLVMEQSHDSAGKFAGNVFLLQEEAPPLSGNPLTDNPSTGKPLPENPTQREYTSNRKDKKEPPSSPPKSEFAPGVLEAIQVFAGENRDLREALVGFVRNRQAPPKPKPVKTAAGMKSLLTTLAKHSKGRPDVMLLIVNKATQENWTGFWPLREDEVPAAAGPAGEEEGVDGI